MNIPPNNDKMIKLCICCRSLGVNTVFLYNKSAFLFRSLHISLTSSPLTQLASCSCVFFCFKNHLVVWDDLVLSKDSSMVENYYIRARKLDVSVIFHFAVLLQNTKNDS